VIQHLLADRDEGLLALLAEAKAAPDVVKKVEGYLTSDRRARTTSANDVIPRCVTLHHAERDVSNVLAASQVVVFFAANPAFPPTRTDDCKAANRFVSSVFTKAQLSPRVAWTICYLSRHQKIRASELRPANWHRILLPWAVVNGRGRARTWGRKGVCHVQRRDRKRGGGQEAML